ncbi:MAG: hypothetical protein RR346_00880 [Bacteroidales bacterium]
MQRILILLILLAIGGNRLKASDKATDLQALLLSAGMENVRCEASDGMLYLAFEDRVDRQPWIGLAQLMQLCRQHDITSPVSVNLEQNGVARVNLLFEGMQLIEVTSDTRTCSRMLAKSKSGDRPYGKLLITALPVINLRNARTDVIFTVFAGLAPTLQMQLWRGADLTAQIIIPIYNSMEKQFDYIRPGLITLSQRFKIGNRWEMIGSVGNFTNQRAGIHGLVGYHLPNGKWGATLSGGLTGSSTTWGGDWAFSKWKHIDFEASTYLYLAGSNTKIQASAGRYVMEDYGVRGELSRRFRNVTVGLYGMISGGEVNGGFNFILPLAFTRLKRIHPVSFVWPQWYDWEYSAQSGPEYVKKGVGKSYLSRLYERADESYWNPLYIKSQIIHLLNMESK